MKIEEGKYLPEKSKKKEEAKVAISKYTLISFNII